MKKTAIFGLIIYQLVSCGPEPEHKFLSYQNIIILSDLSSRLDNKTSKDLVEIHKIVQFFKNECVKPGKKIGDKSSLSFSTFSDKVSASIDINKIKNLGEKQRFINSTGEYKNKGLEEEIRNFESLIKKIYTTQRNEGLDLISLLSEKISNEEIVKKDTYLTDGVDTTYVDYENHIYIFTDGYLEYRGESENNQFYFGSLEIDKVRNFIINHKVDLDRALELDSSLCLPVCKDKLNRYINLHIMETHERDKNLKLQTYKYPKGLRDNEILEAVWRRWARQSGFNDLTWDKY